MRSGIIVLVSAVVLLSVFSGALRAEEDDLLRPPSRAGGLFSDGPREMFPFVLLKKLGLTPQQEAQIYTIMRVHRGTISRLVTQLEQENEQLASKFFAPGKLSEDDVEHHSQKVLRLREDLLKEGFKAALAIREVLTPQQLTKAAELQQKMRAMRARLRQLFADEE
ncbi:MAG: Spy/CpxP family protein refolding chaperone [Candidatus Binatia bacterium]